MKNDHVAHTAFTKIPYWTKPTNIMLNVFLRPLKLVGPPLVQDCFGCELRRRPDNKYLRWLSYAFSNDYAITLTERVVEVPFVFQNMTLPEGSRILEFGCSQSIVSIQLASLGYEVTGVDCTEYQFTHPSFHFVRTDFLNNQFPDEYFDGVVAVSAIEHAGLGFYGDTGLQDGDRRVMDEVYRVLKDKGHVFITVPFGKRGKTPWYRVYDDTSLTELLTGFSVLQSRFFLGEGRSSWLPVEKQRLAHVESVKGAAGVACVHAIKA